jgi:hypothetical protein
MELLKPNSILGRGLKAALVALNKLTRLSPAAPNRFWH